MTILIWRYSHFTLAVSSFIFILIAAITGVILAFEPISNQLKPYSVAELENISIAEVVSVLNKNYDEVISIEIDANEFVLASVVTKEGKGASFYINPITAEQVGVSIQKAPIFRFSTSLHRSLFFKKIGRFFVGLTSFLLFLITVSGILLIVKRQGGFKKFFSKTVHQNFYQYYHIVFGKLSLIPIIIITTTGVYLSLEKFDLLPSTKLEHNINFEILNETPKRTTSAFPIFQNTTLAEVRRIEFPFSKDVEDYFTLELKDREVLVNQITGNIISEIEYPFTKIVSYYSLILHTGEGNIWWSIVLLVASCIILFFIYSGFKMTLQRKKQSSVVKNKFSKDSAKYIILVGSETGSTYAFAAAFYKGLIEQGQSVFISELNKYTTYKKATNLIVFTATYGEGDAPSNAENFKKLFDKTTQQNTLNYSVVGFGSLAYTDYCKYAIIVDATLQKHPKFNPNVPLCKINKQSFEVFKIWTQEWSTSVGLSIEVNEPLKKNTLKNRKSFIVKEKTALNIDNTFLLSLKLNKKEKFRSGDLLSIIPEKDNLERLYSISKIDDTILLSVKKHEFGVVSQYFLSLKKDTIVKASIAKNTDFHFPRKTKNVIFISNGTGIGPFLGMLEEARLKQNIHLFWGGRTQKSFHIYEPYLESIPSQNLHIAYSQENERHYVQALLETQKGLLIKTIKSGGVIMICGSVAMQTQVLKVIETVCENNGNCSVNELEKKGQLLMDCY